MPEKRHTVWCVSFLLCGDGFEKLNAARVSAAGEGWTEPNLYFCPPGRNANESVLPFWTLATVMARPEASEPVPLLIVFMDEKHQHEGYERPK